MRKIRAIAASLLLIAFLFTSSAEAVSAAFLKYDNTAYTTSVGQTIQVQIIVDPGSDLISGTDAHVTYDPTVLEAQAVTAGTYFPSVSNTITAGKVSIYATVNDPASPKSGSGTIATVTFKGLKNGAASLQYFCDTTAYNTSKIVKNDINATNIITCSQNTTASITVGTGGSTNPTTAPRLDVTPTPITQLPETGIVEDIMPYAVTGVLFVIAGGLFRLLI